MGIETRPDRDSLYHYSCEFNAVNVIARFWQRDAQAHPDLSVNFLGARIPPKVHPPKLNALKGRVEPPPNPGNWHADIAEWAAALRAVNQSKDVFRIVELGCGWGCWLTNTGVAARSIGRTVDLIGVEGNYRHLENAEETLQLNGFSADDFTLFHGIAGPREGKALFPAPHANKTIWNGEAIFYPDTETLERAEADDAVQVLPCYSLPTLSEAKRIDLLHIDIQGAEVDYIKGNLADIDSYVARVLIGTHSRSIEGQLCEIFLDAGWQMEMERPALVQIKAGKPHTTIDGVQMWANPKLA
jgi:FkbM family methyltransferase